MEQRDMGLCMVMIIVFNDNFRINLELARVRDVTNSYR